MKICVPMKSSMVHNHFGKAPAFMLLAVEERKVVSKEVISNPGREKGAALELMPAHGVTHVIAGGMGELMPENVPCCGENLRGKRS